MKVDPAAYRVGPGDKVKLSHRATRTAPLYRSEREYRERAASDAAELHALQGLLFASDRQALLLIFQGMDAAGKDGAINHVLRGANPQGCEVHSFKAPSAEELAHDFLWRTTCRLPARGRIGVFNRSYYEDVLIVRVHPELLRPGMDPGAAGKADAVWSDRYRSIVELEKHLRRNGTRILKFFLHVSKDEQRKRFLKRLTSPEKNWKFSAADVTERQFRKRYRRAYEHCLNATSTKVAPWHVVPADNKRNARLIVSRIVIEALEELKMQYPPLDASRRAELAACRRNLAGRRAADAAPPAESAATRALEPSPRRA